MLLPAFFDRMAVDNVLLTYCNCAAYRIFHDAMTEIVDAWLRLIFRMWHRAGHFPFLQ
jgi:hypothetical protein